jgi:hypothetical protein
VQASLGRALSQRPAIGDTSSAHHLQPQHLLKRIKIAITMQELIPGKQAKRSDPTIHSFPHGVTTLPQGTIILGSCDRVLSASRRKDIEGEKLISYPSKIASVGYALKHFAQDHIG